MKQSYMEPSTSSSHPVVKVAVGVGAVVLVIIVLMSVVSFIVGSIWKIVELALLAAVVVGIWHMARRHRQLARAKKNQAIPHHSA